MSNSLRPHGSLSTRLLSIEFSRQEYWSGLPFPTPGDLLYWQMDSCIGRWILYHWATWETLSSEFRLTQTASLIAQLVESTCNAGDPSLIPESGRLAGEGISYPLQYSWASLVAQLVKNLPAMQEIWVQSLGWKDPLEKGKATHSSILAWRIPWTV